MDVRIEPAPTKKATIEAIYAALDAPAWVAANLDALADVLQDLSWRPPGPLTLHWQIDPLLPADEVAAIHDVLVAAVAESAYSPHRLRLQVSDE